MLWRSGFSVLTLPPRIAVLSFLPSGPDGSTWLAHKLDLAGSTDLAPDASTTRPHPPPERDGGHPGPNLNPALCGGGNVAQSQPDRRVKGVWPGSNPPWDLRGWEFGSRGG